MSDLRGLADEVEREWDGEEFMLNVYRLVAALRSAADREDALRDPYVDLFAPEMEAWYAALAEVARQLPATFYADQPVIARVRTMVERWQHAVAVVNDAEPEPWAVPLTAKCPCGLFYDLDFAEQVQPDGRYLLECGCGRAVYLFAVVEMDGPK